MTPRHFARQLTPPFAAQYCSDRGLALPETLRGGDATRASQAIANFILASESDAAGTIQADIVRCVPLLGERGQEALAAAIRDEPSLVETIAALANDHERCLHALLHHPQRVEQAEAFLFADLHTEGRWGRDYELALGLTMRCDEEARLAFASALKVFFRSRDGSGRSCVVEVLTRDEDDRVQATIYLEGLPQSEMQTVDGEFQRVVGRRAVEAAVVYSQVSGRLTVVANGGRPVHDRIQQDFTRIMLGAAPAKARAKAGHFQLDRLLRESTLAPLPAHGVVSARVRRLRLRPNDGVGRLTVEAPARPAHVAVSDVSGRWFGGHHTLFAGFVVETATVTLHYAASPDRPRARAINIEMSRSGTSNIRRLPRDDRPVAEAHLVAWGLVNGRRADDSPG